MTELADLGRMLIDVSDGRVLETKSLHPHSHEFWTDCNYHGDPCSFNLSTNQYRLKPVPKTVTLYELKNDDEKEGDQIIWIPSPIKSSIISYDKGETWFKGTGKSKTFEIEG